MREPRSPQREPRERLEEIVRSVISAESISA